ncbi:MAG: FeoB-associated Cys-rich membrane protein [Clostridiales bacterium]|nr:FeoB-associated Cys-rich membrane protein [Clostridiales bacterium]
MINYIIGTGVAALVIVIIANNIMKLKRGETGCSSACSGCGSSSTCAASTEENK